MNTNLTLGYDFVAALVAQGLTDAMARTVMNDPSVAVAMVAAVRKNPLCMDTEQLFESWRIFGKDVGINFGLDGLVPNDPGGFGWIIPVLPPLFGPENAFGLCREVMPKTWKWTEEDLNKITKDSPLCPSRDKIIRIRASIEADEEWKSVSYNMLKQSHAEKRFSDLTRTLVLHAWFYHLTRKFLDEKFVTLCAGSLCSGGLVPRVFVGGGGLWVGRCLPGSADDFLRARQAVS